MQRRLDWHCRAVQSLRRDERHAVETPLIHFVVRHTHARQTAFYLKDESRHPTGTSKHRLARSLILYALCSGALREGMPIVETGPTSSLAALGYLAKLIGAPMQAVVASDTPKAVRSRISEAGAHIYEAAAGADLAQEARALAASLGGCYLDQFENAHIAADWRGNHALAQTLFTQFEASKALPPDWIVVGANTGATAASIGRYMRADPVIANHSRLCVVDPVGSAHMGAFRHNDFKTKGALSQVIDDIGAVAPGAAFAPNLIDRMIATPDAGAIAACLWFERTTNGRVSPSTGANLVGALALMAEMRREGASGDVVTIIAGDGGPYADTVYNPAWRAQHKLDDPCWTAVFERFAEEGEFPCALDTAEAPFVAEAEMRKPPPRAS